MLHTAIVKLSQTTHHDFVLEGQMGLAQMPGWSPDHGIIWLMAVVTCLSPLKA